jgi:hypothetical protein
MRLLVGTFIPFLLQVFGYLIVFAASRGNGSFVGLLALPVALAAVPMLLAVGILGARSSRPLSNLVLATYTIALLPPVLLLVLNAVVT